MKIPTSSRHKEILSLLSALRSVSVGELASRLSVSEVTIRKDLTLLEEMGHIRRNRGGAVLAEDSQIQRPVRLRKAENLDAKGKIARRAASLIREGDTILLDAGSTTSALAMEIANMTLRVITNSLDVMNILADRPGISLLALGGNYRKEAGSFIGPLAGENLKKYKIETCFLGATGVSVDGVFTAQNTIEADLKAQILKSSSRRIILADSEKLGSTAFSVFAEAADVDILITDRNPELVDVYRKMGLEVLLPEE